MRGIGKAAAALVAVSVGIVVMLIAPARVNEKPDTSVICPGANAVFMGEPQNCGGSVRTSMTWAWLLGNRNRSDFDGSTLTVREPDIALDIAAAFLGATFTYFVFTKRSYGK